MEARNKNTRYCKEVYSIWKKKENQKVCAVDLDDTLSYSIEHWIDFVNKELNTKFNDINKIKNKLSYNKYRNLKFKYRECGTKNFIKVRQEAREFTEQLKYNGYDIIIITARPFAVHKNLFNITANWLDKNKIIYDGIIWGKDKHIKAMTEVENLSFIVDDHRYIANTCGKFGIKTYLLTNKYNKGELNKNVTRINNLLQIIKKENMR